MALLRKSLRQRQQAIEDRRPSTIRNILSRLKRHFTRMKPTIPSAEELTGAEVVANPWDYMNHVIDISRRSGDPDTVAGRLGYTTPLLASRPCESEHVHGEYPRSAQRLRFPLPPDYFKLAPDFSKNEDHPRMRPLPPTPLAQPRSRGDWDNRDGEAECVTKPKVRRIPPATNSSRSVYNIVSKSARRISVLSFVKNTNDLPQQDRRGRQYSPPPSPFAERKNSFGHESAVTWVSIPSHEPIATPPYRRKALATMSELDRQDSFHSMSGAKWTQNTHQGRNKEAHIMGNGRGENNTIPFPSFFHPPPCLDCEKNTGSLHHHADQAERSQSSCSHVATLNDDTVSDSESEYVQADHLSYLDTHYDNDVNEDDVVGDIPFEYNMLKVEFEQQRTIVRTLEAHLQEAQRMIVRQNAQIQRLTRSVRWLSSLTVFEEHDQMTQDEQDTLNVSSRPQVRWNNSGYPPRRRTTHRSAKSGSPNKNIPSYVGPIPPPRFLENEMSRTLDVDNSLSESDTMNDDDYDILKKPLGYSDMIEVAGQEQKFAQATMKPLPDVDGPSITTSNEDDTPSLPSRKKMLIVPIYDTRLETPERVKTETESKPRSKVHNYDGSQTLGIVANHVGYYESSGGNASLYSDIVTCASTRVGHEIDLETLDNDVTPRALDFVKIGPPPRPYKSSFQGGGIGKASPQDAHEQIRKSSGALRLRLLPDFHDMVVYQQGNEMNNNDSNVPYEMSTSSTLTWV